MQSITENRKSLVEILESIRSKEKGITFISDETVEEFLSFEDLYQNACSILSYFKEQGIIAGDEVILQFRNNINFIRVFWGCLVGGIIPVPLSIVNNAETKKRLLTIWETLNQPHLVTDIDDYELPSELTAKTALKNKMFFYSNNWLGFTGAKTVQVLSSDIAFIQFSSGSTGSPKGVTLTHENLIANITASIKAVEMKTQESTLSWMPLTHDMGIIGFHLNPLRQQMNHFIMPTYLFIKRPMLWMKKISQHKVNITSSPNFGFKYFLDSFNEEKMQGVDLSSIRSIFNGAEPISKDICCDFTSKMIKYNLSPTAIFPVYGLAEASLAVSFPPISQEIVTHTINREKLNVGEKIEFVDAKSPLGISFVDVGYALDEVKIKICDNDRIFLSENIIGKVLIKGKNVTKGYYNNPQETLKAISPGGWLDTGDLGFITNNRLVITGRVKDVLFINGQNYYSHDIERVSSEINGLKLGKVAAVDIYNNQKQMAEIVLFCDIKKGEIKDFDAFSHHVIGYIYSKTGLKLDNVIPVNNIPKTTSGKLQRHVLKERFENQTL